MRCTRRISKKYAIDRLVLPSLWHVQEMILLTQIEMVALEEASSLLLKKPKCPLINLVGDNISTPANQPLGCAPWNLFGNGTFAPIYKPLDPDAWPKSRIGKKVRRLDIFKLSIMQGKKKKGATNF